MTYLMQSMVFRLIDKEYYRPMHVRLNSYKVSTEKGKTKELPVFTLRQNLKQQC